MDQVRNESSALSACASCITIIAGGRAGAWPASYGLTHWQPKPDFGRSTARWRPRMPPLVVQKLKESGVEYRCRNGTTVLVPSDRVAELRLDMAAAGLPKSGRIGFELFDKTNFGSTDFAEHVNYQRALEGELERSVWRSPKSSRRGSTLRFPRNRSFSNPPARQSQRPAQASRGAQLTAAERRRHHHI